MFSGHHGTYGFIQSTEGYHYQLNQLWIFVPLFPDHGLIVVTLGLYEECGHPGVPAQVAVRLHPLHEQLFLTGQPLLLTCLIKGGHSVEFLLNREPRA